MRACAVCGARCEGDRCAAHARRGSWGSRLYRRNRAYVVARAELCWRCDRPFTAEDPATAGHVIPLAEGGTDALSNLAAEHESCNKRAGRAQQDAPPAWRPFGISVRVDAMVPAGHVELHDERGVVARSRLFA